MGPTQRVLRLPSCKDLPVGGSWMPADISCSTLLHRKLMWPHSVGDKSSFCFKLQTGVRLWNHSKLSCFSCVCVFFVIFLCLFASRDARALQLLQVRWNRIWPIVPATGFWRGHAFDQGALVVLCSKQAMDLPAREVSSRLRDYFHLESPRASLRVTAKDSTLFANAHAAG